MRHARSALAMSLLALGVSGCAEYSYFRDGAASSVAEPNPGLLPPTANPISETNQKLRDLPPPKSPIAVAVYGYGDQTGQMKPMAQGANVQTLSRAVTQGATSILLKALQDAGCGRWFTVIERERLDNLLKERRIIADMRQRYLGEQVVDPQALPPLLFAGVLLDGGIIGYDSNTKTGGLGANYLAIGGNANYTEDTVTVYLRGTSVKTGQVLLSVVATKKILSYGVDGNAFRYVTFNRLLQAEVGFTRNEPGTLAVEQAIEQAVLMFIVEGSARGLWAFQDRGFQSHIIEDYELSYLAVAQANVAAQGGAPANNGQNGGTAVATAGDKTTPANPARGQAQPAMANDNAPAPVKPASAPVNPAPSQARPATATGNAPIPAQPVSQPSNPALRQGQTVVSSLTPARMQAQPTIVAQNQPQLQPVQFAGLRNPSALPQPQPAVYPQQRTADASGNTTVQAKTPTTQPQAAPQPMPKIIVQPRTLEDEVPIAPR